MSCWSGWRVKQRDTEKTCDVHTCYSGHWSGLASMRFPLQNRCLILALLLIAYGTSDNTGVQETLVDSSKLFKKICRDSVEPMADRYWWKPPSKDPVYGPGRVRLLFFLSFQSHYALFTLVQSGSYSFLPILLSSLWFSQVPIHSYPFSTALSTYVHQVLVLFILVQLRSYNLRHSGNLFTTLLQFRNGIPIGKVCVSCQAGAFQVPAFSWGDSSKYNVCVF